MIDKLIVIFILLIVVLVPVSIYYSIQEQKAWNVFSIEQNCKIVGKKKAQTSTGVAPIISGQGGIAIVVSTIPAQTGWFCDDGITYWR